ncbi:MAG: PAS domain S-box protein [Spirulinaceae cyanobacterium]
MSKELLTTSSATLFEAVKRNADLTGTLLNSVNALVLVLDCTGRIIHFNRHCEQLTGYCKAEVIGEVIWEKLVAPDSAAKTQNIFAAAIAHQKEVQDYQSFWLSKQGKKQLISWANSTCFSPKGEIEYFIATGTVLEPSCSQQKQAQIHERLGTLVDSNQKLQAQVEQLQRSERKYKALFAHTFQSIAMISPQGILLDANEVALDFGGLKLEEIQGQPFWQVRWWQKSPAIQEKLRKAILTANEGEFVRYEVEILGKQDEVVTIDFSLKPVFNPEGRVVVIISEGRDISNLKKAEEALQQLNQELDTKVRRRTSLLKRIIENLTTEIEQRLLVEAQQQRLISILEASTDCISLADSEGQLVWSNSSSRKVLGLTSDADISRLKIFDYHPQSTVKIITELGIPTAVQNGVWVGETTLQTSQGKEIPVSQMIIAHKNQSGDVEYFSTVSRNLSQQKQVETDLAASYNLLQTIIDSTSDAIFVKDTQGRYQFINQPGAKILNRTVAEVLGQDDTSFFPPEILGEVQAKDKKIINSGISEEIEETLTIAGETQVFLTSKNVYRNAQGEVLGLVGLAKDITSLKQTQEELEQKVKVRTAALETQIQQRQEAEEILHLKNAEVAAILRSVPDALVFVNSQRKIIEVNSAFTKLFGYKPSEAIGQNSSVLYSSQEDYQEQGRKRYHLNAEDQLLPYEVTYSRKDGSSFISETVGSQVTDDEGNSLGFLGIIRDITKRKEAELALQASEERLRLFITNAPIAIAMFDVQMCYLANSKNWLAQYNLNGEDIVGRSHYEIFPSVPQRWQEIHKHCLAGAIEKCDEDSFVRADGSTEWLRWEIHPWFKNQGEIGGIIMFTEVITERINSRHQLQQVNQELLNSNQELEQFAYIASHDLREPLRKIQSYVELLEEKYQGQLDEKADKYISALTKGTTRMQNLISDLLTYSRVHRTELLRKPTDLNSILEQVRDDLGVAIAQTKAQILVAPLPTISVHPGQITQLLQNLVANAIKFQGDGTPVIQIKAQQKENEWLISIADNGVGIKSRYTEQVFEIFQRLHSRSKYEGTGIGLAICKKIVERHGGKIWLKSEFGKGTTFYFTLPVNG